MKDRLSAWWQSLSGATNAEGVSVERAMVRLGMLVLFYGLAVLLVSRGEPPLDIRPGEEAQRDYVARIEFTCEDLPETGRQRWRAEYREANVYFHDTTEMERMRTELAAFLEKVRTATDLQNLGASGPVTWQSSLEALAAFQQELQAIPSAKVDEALNALVNALAIRGVMTAKEFDDEDRRGQNFIHIFSSDSSEARKLPMARIVRLGPEVGGHLVEAVAAQFPDRSPQFRLAFIEMAAQALRPTLKFHKERTEKAKEAARNAVPVQRKVVKRGAMILARGAKAEMQHIRELATERDLYAESLRWSASYFRKVGGASLVVLMAFLGSALYIGKYARPIVQSNTRLVMLCVLCVGVLGLARGVMAMGWSLHVIPASFAALTLCIAYDQRLALALTVPLVLLIGILAGNHYSVACVLLAGCAAGIACTASIRNRQKLIKVGLVIGLTHFFATWSFGFLSGLNVPAYFWESPLLADSLWGLAAGLAVGVITSGALPLIEYAFDATTDVSLLEWSDLNQPLLRRLMLEAPGTYHHSLIVGNLAENAAEAIKANSLVARVGAYYHDIGKLTKPAYFVENVAADQSAHNGLTPGMSALVVIAHAKQGLELAARYRVPRAIRDIILEHHGTTVVEYFYDQAMKSGARGAADETSFRYHGPKPRTKEAAIVMLSDSVESASRVLAAPTPSRIEELVRNIVSRKLADEQFAGCPITLTEVYSIEQSLIRGLNAIFHSRIKYPESQSENRDRKPAARSVA